jgi:hypothetical protein
MGGYGSGLYHLKGRGLVSDRSFALLGKSNVLKLLDLELDFAVQYGDKYTCVPLRCSMLWLL